MSKYEVIRDYGTHQYKSIVEKSDLFCLNCGKRTVWIEQGAGDYYEGPEHYCTSCNHQFTNPSISEATDVYKSVIDQIKVKEKANQLIDNSTDFDN